MNIGIIGAGNIGATAARLLTQAGHQVVISNGRGPATLLALAQEIGVRAVTVEEAAQFGEIVLLAIPFKDYTTLPSASLRDKVVIDAMNYYPQRDGTITFPQGTSSELVAQFLGSLRLIKAFNTMESSILGSAERTDAPAEERLALFIAGDDASAKAIVTKLIAEMGFTAVDTGSLHDGGKRQQPGTAVYGQRLTAREAQSLLQGS